MPITLEQSRDWCHQVMRHAARNFYFGMSLLPEAKRSAMFALYAYMRHIDDLADDAIDAGADPAVARQYLLQWREMTHAALAGQPQPHPIFPALCEAVTRYGIPSHLLDDAIDGQLSDLCPVLYQSFDQLQQYCYRVASTVGIAAVYIWRFHDRRAIALADERGIAFQLTNILRDLREDYARGRTYLPQEDLARFGVDLGSALQGRQNHAFLDLMHHQIARTRAFYDRSEPLEQLVEPDARPTLCIMTGIYRGILERIAQDPLAVLSHKVSLSSAKKLSCVAQGIWADEQRRIAGLA